MKVRINWNRAHEVFSRLLNSYHQLEPPYAHGVTTLPQKQLPKNLQPGTREHALFLWVVTLYMRGGLNSNRVYEALLGIHENHEELFASTLVGNGNQTIAAARIRELLHEEGLKQKADEISQFWAAGLHKLALHWNGDPRELFADSASYEKVCGRIICDNAKYKHEDPHGFPGFREKLVSMLAYYLMEAGLISPLVFPVPTDFHVMRVLTSHRILYVPKAQYGDDLMRGQLQKAGRRLTAGYCRKYGVSPVELSNVLWLLSRTFCKLHPGNATLQPEGYDARKTTLVPMKVTWSRSQVRRFERSCAICPAGGTCKYNVPAAEYYRKGRIVLRGEREEPPSYNLDLFTGF